MAGPSFEDDATIPDEADLWRRIHPSWVIPDQNIGSLRVSSAAFDDSPDGSPLSMLLADIVRETGRSESDVLVGFQDYSLAALKAADARTNGQKVSPTPTKGEPAHVSVAGPKTKSTKRGMARASRWVVQPNHV